MASSSALPNQAIETPRRQEKRARVAGIAVDPNWRDWADLIAGPAGLIAERVLADDVADYLRFRAVCRTWRRCAASPLAYNSLDRRFHPRRWIMLPLTLGAARKRRGFLNVSTGERIQVDLPELRYQFVFGATSDGGLIVLCDKRTYAVRLFNPLTRQFTNNLPPAATRQYNASTQRFTSKRTLCLHRVLNASLADDSTVFLHTDTYWLFTAKPGDKQWKRLRTGRIVAASPFAGRFYCLTEIARAIMVVDTAASADPRLTVAVKVDDLGSMEYDQTVKLVDNDGELLLLRRIPRDNNNNNNTYREGYEGYRVDLEAGITLPMQRGIGEHALFVCRNHCGLGRALLLPARLSPYVHAGTVYSCDGFNTHTPRIEAYRLLYGDARHRLLCFQTIRAGNGDARPCSIMDSVLHYICGSNIIIKERRRSERIKLRRRLRLMSALDQSNVGGQSQ